MLASALVGAQRAIGAIGKNSRNEFAQFDYVSADDMVAHARKALNDNGLAVLQGNVELLANPVGFTARIYYTVTHLSGESLDYFVDRPVVEAKGRPLDKALDSAQTTGLSYFLRGLLQIPRSTDKGLDVEARNDEAYEPAAPAPKAPAPKPVAKPAPAPKKAATLPASDDDGLDRVLREARNLDELKMAWELCALAGKNNAPHLVALKDARKAELS